jgi:uncharacterized repeat protein (TIGR03803 family)
MKTEKFSHALRSTIAIAVVSLASATLALAQYTPTTLYNFPNVGDGQQQPSDLIWDTAGNLYGTANILGDSCVDQGECGIVFELSQSGGVWTETTLYTLTRKGLLSPGIVMDSHGSLFGATLNGGLENDCNAGCGSIYELSPSDGGWTFKVIHDFNFDNGARPNPPMVGADGNLYGTTQNGGSGGPGEGVVYRLSQTAKGGWVSTVLHRFADANDGSVPASALIQDTAGNLYGTTSQGGPYGGGSVFKLTANGAGGFKFGWIYDFGNSIVKGINPFGTLVIDPLSGSLYGTTQRGGRTGPGCTNNNGCGVVFELVYNGTGYTYKTIKIFQPTEDGENTAAGLVEDTAGNLYGTTPFGKGFTGTVFELTPTESGWQETILFTADSDLASFNGVLLDSSGNLYGPASTSKIFELSPPTP